jgi:hypothetical protein
MTARLRQKEDKYGSPRCLVSWIFGIAVIRYLPRVHSMKPVYNDPPFGQFRQCVFGVSEGRLTAPSPSTSTCASCWNVWIND